MKWNQVPSLNQSHQQALKYARYKSRVGKLLTLFFTKASENQGLLSQVWEELQTLFSLLRDWQSGSYSRLPWRALLLSLTAVLYFVNPLDLVPDFIPGLGYIDDIAVFGMIFRAIQKDVNQYRKWKVREKDSMSGGSL